MSVVIPLGHFLRQDYFDPIFIRGRESRGFHAHKAYGVVFICLVTRAIYLELVIHLDTPSFITTFNRFASRRGKPMIKDNGKNFVGANAELRRAFVNATKDVNFPNSLIS